MKRLSGCRIRTEPRRFAEVLGGRPRARILLEASVETEWVARSLEGLGHEVVVADPNVGPMHATRTRKVVCAARWVSHGQFTGQDAWMVDVMEIPPERLYRPDAWAIEWRRLVEEQHREFARSAGSA